MTHRNLAISLALLLTLGIGCEPHPSQRPDVGPGGDSGDTPDDRDSTVPACPHVGQMAVPEVCNVFDDDCDGLLDEGVCSDPCDVFDERP
ncbi:MAG: hypothetical protein M3Y87_09615 [Myxococcota bacterium]|nr:hypothetical protein [Myxococcota bacterium]